MFIYIFNLLYDISKSVAKPTIEIDMFLEIDGELFADKHMLHCLSNQLSKHHTDKINTISNNIRMMNMRLQYQNNCCSGLLRIDSEEQLSRESLKGIIDSAEDLDEFISKYEFEQ